MKVYRISREKLDELRPALMRRVALVLTVTFGLGAFAAFRALGDEADLRVILAEILLLSGMAALGAWKAGKRGRAQLDEMASTFELTLDAGRLLRRQRNLPEITMNYSDIRQIQQQGDRGLKIVGTSKLDAIGITSAVENYDQLKSDLVLLTGLEISRKKGPPAQAWTFLALIVVIALFAVSFLAPNRFVASCASFVLAFISLAGIVVIRRNPNVPKELKGRLLLSLIAPIVLLARGILLLRS